MAGPFDSTPSEVEEEELEVDADEVENEAEVFEAMGVALSVAFEEAI